MLTHPGVKSFFNIQIRKMYIEYEKLRNAPTAESVVAILNGLLLEEVINLRPLDQLDMSCKFVLCLSDDLIPTTDLLNPVIDGRFLNFILGSEN